MIQKYALEIAYKGTTFHGWQIQKNAYTVQECINAALSTLLKKNTQTLGSSRTDTGVHALCQWVSFETESISHPPLFLYQLNALLPPDIAAKQLCTMNPDCSVRFDATCRRYEYRMHTTKNPFLNGFSYHIHNPLPDIEKMNLAAQKLLNYHDFQSFCKYHSAAEHFLCTISEAYWLQHTATQYTFYIAANRFLRGMVRAIVGTLIELGRGKINQEDFVKIIESKNRIYAKNAAPSEGLYLTHIEYPEGIMQKIA